MTTQQSGLATVRKQAAEYFLGIPDAMSRVVPPVPDRLERAKAMLDFERRKLAARLATASEDFVHDIEGAILAMRWARRFGCPAAKAAVALPVAA